MDGIENYNDILNKDFDLIIIQNINDIKTTKNSRKRQDNINKASKKK